MSETGCEIKMEWNLPLGCCELALGAAAASAALSAVLTVLPLAVQQGLPETSRDLPAHQADVLQEDLTPSPEAWRQSKCKGEKNVLEA